MFYGSYTAQQRTNLSGPKRTCQHYQWSLYLTDTTSKRLRSPEGPWRHLVQTLHQCLLLTGLCSVGCSTSEPPLGGAWRSNMLLASCCWAYERASLAQGQGNKEMLELLCVSERVCVCVCVCVCVHTLTFFSLTWMQGIRGQWCVTITQKPCWQKTVCLFSGLEK